LEGGDTMVGNHRIDWLWVDSVWATIPYR